MNKDSTKEMLEFILEAIHLIEDHIELLIQLLDERNNHNSNDSNKAEKSETHNRIVYFAPQLPYELFKSKPVELPNPFEDKSTGLIRLLRNWL